MYSKILIGCLDSLIEAYTLSLINPHLLLNSSYFDIEENELKDLFENYHIDFASREVKIRQISEASLIESIKDKEQLYSILNDFRSHTNAFANHKIGDAANNNLYKLLKEKGYYKNL